MITARFVREGDYVVAYNPCPFCGKMGKLTISVSEYQRIEDGALIQDALPESTKEQRELLMTGICSSCFPDDPEEDYPDEDYIDFEEGGDFDD